MPTSYDNIQISTDIGAEKNFVAYFPTILQVGQSNDYSDAIPVAAELGVESSGFSELTSEHSTASVDYSSYIDLYSEYYSFDSTSPSIDFLDVSITHATALYDDLYTTINEFRSRSYKIDWFNSLDVDFYSHPKILSYDSNLINYFKIYKGTVEFENSLPTILSLSKSRMFNIYDDVYCSNIAVLTSEIDAEVGKGRIIHIVDDIYSTTEGQKYTIQDIYSSDYSIISTLYDIEDIEGRIVAILSDSYSTYLSIEQYILNDIRLNSLNITNFSLDYSDYMFFGDYVYVDILDYLFDIDTSDSYFELDGVRLTTLFETIPYGVRARCLIDNLFVSTEEQILKVVGKNTEGDINFENFKLLFGYSVELNKEIVFDYNKKILVKSCATNEVQCPNNECGSFVFTTGDYPSYNLNASISCVVSCDLTAEIVPQSTALFYGKSYRIVISGIKDYSGNKMPSTELLFTIESV